MSEESKEQVRTEAAGSKRPSRKRGTAFPVVSLPEAARILKDARKYGFEHHIGSFATYMGHSSTNSGAFRQRLAAFRDWELIEGRGDTLTLTETARRIAMPTDEAGERQALQQAFKNCDVFTGLYDKMAKGQPLDRDGLAAQAVHGSGVSPAKAHQFVRSFVESVVAAQMAEEDDQGNVVLLEPGIAEQAESTDVSGEKSASPDPDQTRDALPSHSIHGQPSGAGSPTIRQSWPITGGEIILEVRSAESLPATAFGAIGDVVTKLEELAASLSPANEPDVPDGGGES